MRGNQILDKMLIIQKISVYSISSEFDIFSQAWILHVYVYYMHFKITFVVIFAENAATLHYINLAFRWRDCDVVSQTKVQKFPFIP